MPHKIDTTPTVQGNNLSFDVNVPKQEVPHKQRVFIEKLGWAGGYWHPDTGEELFQKHPPSNCTDEVRNSWASDLNYNYWHWYEAVAYEFTKFMGIEDDSGKSHSGNAEAASASSSSVGAAAMGQSR